MTLGKPRTHKEMLPAKPQHNPGDVGCRAEPPEGNIVDEKPETLKMIC